MAVEQPLRPIIWIVHIVFVEYHRPVVGCGIDETFLETTHYPEMSQWLHQ